MGRTEDAASVEVAVFEGDRATPADNDLAYISLRLSDSAGNQDEQARIGWSATTVLNGATQDGDLILSALVNGTITEMLRLDGSAGTVTISAPISAQVEVADDILFTLGNDNDGVLLNRSTILATNTALTGVMIGTPVTPAVAANSVIVSNVTASGDYLLALNVGGNSQAWQWVDSSAGTQTLYAAGVARWLLNSTGGSFTGTISDLGIVTTVDINGGTVDGAVIGGASAAAATVTTLVVNTSANPDADDGAVLGASGTAWSDLFLASGAVINFAAGDVTLTHSSNLLAATGGTLYLHDGSAATLDADITAPFAATPSLVVLNNPGVEVLQILVANGANALGPLVNQLKTRSTAGDANTIVVDGDAIAGIAGYAADGASYQRTGSIILRVDGTPGAGDTPGRWVFSTTPDGSTTETERWRITNAGVLSSLAAAPVNVTVDGSIIVSGGAAGGVAIGADALANLFSTATNGAGSTTMYIGNASITTSSDARLKSNIRPWEGPSIVDQLEVVEFDQHSNRPFGDVEHYVSLTAQNVYKVAPWAVNTQGGKDCVACLSAVDCDKHLPWQVNFGLLVGVLVKEIQQLRRAA